MINIYKLIAIFVILQLTQQNEVTTECHIQCKSCSGTQSSDCLTCYQNASLNNFNQCECYRGTVRGEDGQCNYCQSPLIYFQQECLEECPLNTTPEDIVYNSVTIQQCVQIQETFETDIQPTNISNTGSKSTQLSNTEIYFQTYNKDDILTLESVTQCQNMCLNQNNDCWQLNQSSENLACENEIKKIINQCYSGNLNSNCKNWKVYESQYSNSQEEEVDWQEISESYIPCWQECEKQLTQEISKKFLECFLSCNGFKNKFLYQKFIILIAIFYILI